MDTHVIHTLQIICLCCLLVDIAFLKWISSQYRLGEEWVKESYTIEGW